LKRVAYPTMPLTKERRTLQAQNNEFKNPRLEEIVGGGKDGGAE
jgi:hypothetical protein